MDSKIEYTVDITSGRFLPEQMKTETIKFSDEDPFKARQKALYYVAQSLETAVFDDPDLVIQIPEMVHNVDAFSIDIYFSSGDIECPIFGTEVHDVLTGLFEEAKFYLKNNLIKEEDLIKILENSKPLHKDPDNPAYVVTIDMKELPDFDYYVISVLPFHLEFILSQFPTY